jgi:hypothetical protein
LGREFLWLTALAIAQSAIRFDGVSKMTDLLLRRVVSLTD